MRHFSGLIIITSTKYWISERSCGHNPSSDLYIILWTIYFVRNTFLENRDPKQIEISGMCYTL